jgi:hypothetical protein
VYQGYGVGFMDEAEQILWIRHDFGDRWEITRCDGGWQAVRRLKENQRTVIVASRTTDGLQDALLTHEHYRLRLSS